MSHYYSSEEFASASIKAGALRDRRNWFGSLVSLAIPIIGLGAFNAMCFEFIPRLNLMNLVVSSISIAFVSYNIYCFITETNLIRFYTGLSAVGNQKLIVQVFEELGWLSHTLSSPYRRKRSVIRLIVGPKAITALPADSILYLNVMRKTTGKGEIPASFGSNTEYIQKIITALKKQLPITSS